jgi:hypothetical protein
MGVGGIHEAPVNHVKRREDEIQLGVLLGGLKRITGTGDEFDELASSGKANAELGFGRDRAVRLLFRAVK